MSSSANTTQRIINALLFIVWGIIALFGLFAGAAHGGKIHKVHEALFNIALITTCLYPLALVSSAIDRRGKYLTWPKKSIYIQAIATTVAVISRFLVF